MNPTGTVVVGVDGSPESRAAVEFALREAARRRALLRVVAAVQLPEYWTIAYGTADLPTPEEVIADTKRLARQILDEVVDAHPELAAVVFTVEAIAGSPGPVLVAAAAVAEHEQVGGAALRAARHLPHHHRPTDARRRADPGRGAGLRSAPCDTRPSPT